MLRQEGLVRSARSRGKGREVGTGVVHADDRIPAGLVEVGREGAVRAHQLDLLQPRHLLGLTGNEATRGDEDGVEDQVGLGGRDLGQHGTHVRIRRRDRLPGANRPGPGKPREHVSKNVGELLGVRTAVVNRRQLLGLEDLKRKLCGNFALYGIAVRGAQVSAVVRSAVRSGE